MTVLQATGKTRLSFEKPKILEVIAEPSVLDEYVSRLESLGARGGSAVRVRSLVRVAKLNDLAELHYEAAVAQDKSFAPAHEKLGHTLVGDRWLNAVEVREAQGLVLYKGKWITKEAREEQEAQLVAGAEQGVVGPEDSPASAGDGDRHGSRGPARRNSN